MALGCNPAAIGDETRHPERPAPGALCTRIEAQSIAVAAVDLRAVLPIAVAARSGFARGRFRATRAQLATATGAAGRVHRQGHRSIQASAREAVWIDWAAQLLSRGGALAA